MMLLLRADGVFMQDGASSHTAKTATAYLGQHMKVLSPWPANSPDLNVLDYAIWGMLQQDVEKQKPEAEIELEVAIKKAAAALTPDILRKSAGQFPKRVALCVEHEGGNFEYKM